MRQVASDYKLDEVLTSACAKDLRDSVCSSLKGYKGMRGKLLQCLVSRVGNSATVYPHAPRVLSLAMIRLFRDQRPVQLLASTSCRAI